MKKILEIMKTEEIVVHGGHRCLDCVDNTVISSGESIFLDGKKGHKTERNLIRDYY